MANEEQLAILKEGVEVWNKWREENLHTAIHLNNTDLRKLNLTGVDFFEADLTEIDFRETNLCKANLVGANLWVANLIKANLVQANFSEATLIGANLSQANLNRASFTKVNLNYADLSETNLIETNFDEADLSGVDFSRAVVKNANFKSAKIGLTIFGELDLSEAIGLDEMHHFIPSTIGTDALRFSKGKIPIKFLRGCGLSDFEIESAKLYNPDLSNHEINEILYKIYELRATQAIQISPLFISYSRADSAFVDRLEIELNAKGIRFWRDIHDAKAGRLELQIEQAIRHNPTVLLVLSQNALQSDWVQHEVRKARGLEKELGRDVLCPVALDGSWKSGGWPERVMAQVTEYNILDFSQWQDDAVFQREFVRLLDGLQLFYKKTN